MAMGETVSNSALWDTRRLARGNTALPSMEALLGGLHNAPLLVGTKLESTYEKSEVKESSSVGNSSKGFKEGSSERELLCLEALHGATKQNPDMQGVGEPPMTWEEHLFSGSLSSENVEGPTEKVGTLGLQSHKKNRGATKAGKEG
jgi:hypothetical protein